MPLRHESRQKSQQCWARGPSRHVSAVFCCRDFAEISAERKNCCRVAQIFRVPKFWDGKTRENKRFCFVSFFGGRQKWLPYTPVGAESGAIAIRTGTPACRWVLNGTQPGLRKCFGNPLSNSRNKTRKYSSNHLRNGARTRGCGNCGTLVQRNVSKTSSHYRPTP